MPNYSFRTNLGEINKTPTGPVRDNPKFSASIIPKRKYTTTFSDYMYDHDRREAIGPIAFELEKNGASPKEVHEAAVKSKGLQVLAAPLAFSAITNPVGTIGGIVGGTLAGEGVNKITNHYSDDKYKTFGQLVNQDNWAEKVLGSDVLGEFVTEGLNPGYWIGGRYGGKYAREFTKTSMPALWLSYNVWRSKSPTIKFVTHATDWTGLKPRVINKSGELGFHVGTDRSPGEFIIKEYYKPGSYASKFESQPTVRTGIFIKYPTDKVVPIYDLERWNPETFYNYLNNPDNKAHLLSKLIKKSEIKGIYKQYKDAVEHNSNNDELIKAAGYELPEETIEKQMLGYKEASSKLLDKLQSKNISALSYINDVEAAGNQSMAILNPDRIWLSPEVIISYPQIKPTPNSSFELLKYFDSNHPAKFYKLGGKLWKK